MSTLLTSSLFAKHSPKKSAKDSGSPESQISLITHRIQEITQHLQVHRKDYSCQRSLLKLIGKRKKQLKYLKNKNTGRYQAICAALSIRK